MAKKHELIAGWKTQADWHVAKASLVIGGDPQAWRAVYRDFYRARLDLRYLNPIKILQDHGTFSGEGFSIAAIQCSLIEFLESPIQGIAYKSGRHAKKLGKYEYSSSAGLFQTFLTTREPFCQEFTAPLARDFYICIRCGLLHEARTKGGWRIHARDSNGRMIDSAQRVLFRDGFQVGLRRFVDAYGVELEQDTNWQSAFIRKFDDLCK
jgi:hypothetical protein